MKLSRLVSGLILLFTFNYSVAQQTPIGYWTSHFPYNNVIGLATDGKMLYAVSELSFFTHNPETGETESYSKVNGMADVGMACVAHDRTTGITILTYGNGNIDLFKDGNFYNIPDFKIRVINGAKTIYGVYTEDGLAYVSTSVGIIVVDLSKKEIKGTYEFVQNEITIPVFGVAATTDYFYSITPKGLYRISRTNPSPQIFSQWQLIDSMALSDITVAGNKLFVGTDEKLYVLQNDTLHYFFGLDAGGDHLDEANGSLLVSKWNALQIINPVVLQVESNYFFEDVKQGVMLTDGSMWAADATKGIAKGIYGTSTSEYIKPDGPGGIASFDIYAYDRNILVAHGSVTDKWRTQYNGNGFSEYKDGHWVQYGNQNFAPLKSSSDFIYITKDRSDGTIYAGSFRDGLFMLNADGTYQHFRQSSPLSLSGCDGVTYPVTGLAIDANNNLWINQFCGTSELLVRTKDNTWYKYDTPYSLGFPNGAASVIIDDIGQKWYISPLGSGVIVYNDGNTPADLTDDSYRQLLAGTGAGNLPNNDVYSIAKDKNNSIWIGTRAGIGIINCTDQVTTAQCDAERPIVQFDQFAGYLFETEIVYAIAVDGANRKWVGTGNGVWLLSPTGEQIVYRFTEENSPLPSNVIKKITVDPVTGDVYIGTDKGLVCYRSTATDGGETNEEKLLTFPNPVPSGYSGSIAIKGLAANSDVRITDLSGQLVYHTTANGGQAVWNGLDYKGRRPQSGVYLVFASNKDGTETTTGKIVFMQ